MSFFANFEMKVMLQNTLKYLATRNMILICNATVGWILLKIAFFDYFFEVCGNAFSKRIWSKCIAYCIQKAEKVLLYLKQEAQKFVIVSLIYLDFVFINLDFFVMIFNHCLLQFFKVNKYTAVFLQNNIFFC